MFIEMRNRKREEVKEGESGFAYYVVVAEAITLDEYLEVKSVIVEGVSGRKKNYRTIFGPMPCERYSYDDALAEALKIAQFETALDWVSSLQIRPAEECCEGWVGVFDKMFGELSQKGVL
jgi:hypothetical protein